MTYLDVDEDGLISLDELEKAIRPDTILISVMFANNEIGTMEQIKEIGAIAKNMIFCFTRMRFRHLVMCRLMCREMNIDMLSASGHKFHGPKGIDLCICATA